MTQPHPDPTQQRHLLTEQSWDAGWEGHEIAQLKRMAALTFAEKVAWLEQAQQITRQFQAAREENPQKKPLP